MKSNKKIGIFFYVMNSDNQFKLGGAERRLSRIFSGLADKGFSTHILLMTNCLDVNILKEYEKYTKNKSTVIKVFDSYFTLYKYMKNENFDWICYTDSYRKMIPFLLFGILLGSNRLMLNVTTYLSEFKFDNLFQQYLFICVAKLSTQIDVLYPSGYKITKNKFSNKKITLTPGAFTDTNLFVPSTKEKSIVFLSSLIAPKNPLLFLDAIISIKDILESYEYKVSICGSGPLFGSLKEKIEKYNMKNLVQLKGNTSSKSELSKAEIFVSIQSFNNYPSQALLEAISSGCYIVASNEGDTAKIVNEDFGCLCDLSVESVSESIKNYIYSDKLKKKSVVLNARKFAVRNFQIDKSIEHYKSIFE